VQSPFDADDQICPVGRHGLEERFWASWHVPVEKNLSILVYDTEVHGAGMQIDAAVILVRRGVESPEVSSSPEVVFPSLRLPHGRRRRGPP
jgi:hypothetical protein